MRRSLPSEGFVHGFSDPGRSQVVNTLRVLVVEDDVLIGALLAELLSTLGHHVCATAQTEADAVAAAAQHCPDLILVDVTLKQGNGVSAMRRIAQTSDARYVFMTGSGYGTFPKGTVILQKPFCEPDLLRALTQVFALPTAVCSSPV